MSASGPADEMNRPAESVPGKPGTDPPSAPPQKGVAAELLSDAFNLDWSVPRTFWGLLRRPGAVAAAYRQRRASKADPLVGEQRRRYAAPFKYVVLTAAIATFVTAFFVDMDEEMRRAGEEAVAIASQGQVSTTDFPSAHQQFIKETQSVGAMMLTRYAALTYLFIYTPIMACVTSLLFGRGKAGPRGTFRYHLGLSAYMWAEFTVLALALTPLALVMESTLWHNNIGLLFMFGYVVWAQVRFFDLSSLRGTLKAVGAFVGAFVLITLASGVLMYGIAYVRVYL